jgi:conjugal transfer pilus assembly protein TraW
MMLSTIFWIEAKDITANGNIDNSAGDSKGILQAMSSDHPEFKAANTSDENAHADAKPATSKITNDAHPKDLGVYGEVFPIEERSLLDVIKAKLQDLLHSGALSDHQNTILQKTKERLNRPLPVENVHKTEKPRSFAYDPSITVTDDLKDHEGRIFHHKGTKVNPLETHSLPCPLLFVDGDDEAQVAWAIGQFKAAGPYHKPKVILVKGAPFELSEKLGFPMYFDQSGALVKKFGITQVPARVSQEGKTLWVEEINPPAASLPLPALKGER